MNMDLRSLRHVVVLAKLLSYTKAAQELCLTQSALTRSIQESNGVVTRDCSIAIAVEFI